MPTDPTGNGKTMKLSATTGQDIQTFAGVSTILAHGEHDGVEINVMRVRPILDGPPVFRVNVLVDGDPERWVVLDWTGS